MAGNNPLNRKRMKEEARRKRRNGDSTEDDTMDQDDLGLPGLAPGFSIPTTGGAFALLAEADIPLPEDEDVDL